MMTAIFARNLGSMEKGSGAEVVWVSVHTILVVGLSSTQGRSSSAGRLYLSFSIQATNTPKSLTKTANSRAKSRLTLLYPVTLLGKPKPIGRACIFCMSLFGRIAAANQLADVLSTYHSSSNEARGIHDFIGIELEQLVCTEATGDWRWANCVSPTDLVCSVVQRT